LFFGERYYGSEGLRMECQKLKGLEDEKSLAQSQASFFSQVNKSVHSLSPAQSKRYIEEQRELAQSLANKIRIHHLICEVCKQNEAQA
jgi:hypothetical protein